MLLGCYFFEGRQWVSAWDMGSGSKAYESATYHAGPVYERVLLRSDEVVADNNPPPTTS